MELLRATTGLALGFVVPGYLIARLAGSRSPWLPAFVTSHVVLFLVLLGLSLLGVPLAYAPVAAILGAFSLVLLALLLRRQRGAPLMAPRPPVAIGKGVLLAAGAGTLLMIFRALLSPLAGYDTYFRWNFLALQLRQLRELSFYPPLAPEDFARYFYVDAIPPLVSFAYFWIYECFDLADPRLTTLLVVVQFTLTLAATFRIAARLGDAAAGRTALLALLASPLFYWAVLQGQETGLTALTFAVSVLVLAEVPGRGGVVLAGACGAACALCREYGPILVVAAAVAARVFGRPWRDALGFIGVAAALAMPWYLRTLALTGNPVYSSPLLGLPVNEVQGALLRAYAGAFWADLHGQPLNGAGIIGAALVKAAPLQLLWGPVAAVALARRTWPLAASALIGVGVWASSVPWTAGGLGPSLRVLAPVLVVASCLIGVHAAPHWARLRHPLLAAAILGGSAAAWAPFAPFEIPLRDALRVNTARNADVILDGLARALRGRPGRILSDSAFAHPGLLRHAVDVAPIWSPEFTFLFDPRLTGREVRTRLWQRGVRFVLLSTRGPNRFVLARLRLLAEDLPGWPLLGRSSDFDVYALPAP